MKVLFYTVYIFFTYQNYEESLFYKCKYLYCILVLHSSKVKNMCIY